MSKQPAESGEDSKIEREREIGQHIGYRYDVNLVPDYKRLTPFLKKYMEVMGWDDLNWLEDVHLGYEEGRAAIFDLLPGSYWGGFVSGDEVTLSHDPCRCGRTTSHLARKIERYLKSKKNPEIAIFHLARG